ECTVFMMAIVIPNRWCSTLATGARQFVVHEALEMTLCLPGSKARSLTPMQIVTSASFDGAEMITCSTLFRRWRDAFSLEVKRPDDSTMISAPTSLQGISAGSGLEKTRISRPSMLMLLSLWVILLGIVPCTESYWSR